MSVSSALMQPVREHAVATKSRVLSPAVIWMTFLFAAICFEGVGRTFMVAIPSVVFYFAKDLVLIVGLILFGIKADVLYLARALYGKFVIFGVLAVVWTVIQMANPGQLSLGLAVLGLRSYWFWCVAPFVVASALRTTEDRNNAIVALAAVSFVVAFYATVQFASPIDAPINSYALYNGESVMDTAAVFATGKVRVSATFSFICGFTDFAILAPIVLLAVGLDAGTRTRFVTVGAAVLVASTAAMTGSRKAVVMCAVGLVVILFRSGFLSNPKGRWMLIALVLAVGFSFYRFSEAVDGVVSRFEGDDTTDRIVNELEILPPVALSRAKYPLFGIGTGMQQSARIPLGIPTEYDAEEEFPRLLAEQGVFGYVAYWIARFGVIVALWRATRLLRHTRQMGAVGGATALALMTLPCNMIFDHVAQALFFTALGVILSATVEASRKLSPVKVRELIR